MLTARCLAKGEGKYRLMDYGDRVLIPATLPWHSDFLEMRRFGSVAEDLACALIFRLVELRGSHKSTSLTKIFAESVPSALIKQLKGEMSSINPDKRTISELVRTLGVLQASYYGCNGVELVSAISQAAGIQISLFNIRGSREESKTSMVDLAWLDQGTLFILYGNMTLDSFIPLKCGHFDAKYKYFQRAQAACQNFAVTQQQLAAIPLASDCCNVNVCTSIIDELFCLKNKTRKPKCKPGLCYLCRNASHSDTHMCSSHQVCWGCAMQVYFTEKWSFTPCCGVDLSKEQLAYIHEEAKKLFHLTDYLIRLKHIREVEVLITALPASPLGKPSQLRVSREKLPSVEAARGFCITCGRAYRSKDATYQCPSACQCKDCSIEAALDAPNRVCFSCKQEYEEEVVNRMRAKWQNCHVCGITRKLKHMALQIPCSVCIRCIIVMSADNSSIGICAQCKGKPHQISEKEIEQTHYKLKFACCRLAKTLQARTLSCGHQVCKVHSRTLRWCRKCLRA